MGIIALALVSSGHLNADFTRPPTWVIVCAALSMSAGTYAGGWRIIRTLGTRIAKIDPPQGFAAQTACASILWLTAHLGYPVSTTQVISGSVMGSGATRGLHAVRWGVAGNIVVAWLFTIPMAGLVGAVMELVTRLPGGDLIVFGLAVVISVGGVRRPPLGDPPAAPAGGARERSDLGVLGQSKGGEAQSCREHEQSNPEQSLHRPAARPEREACPELRTADDADRERDGTTNPVAVSKAPGGSVRCRAASGDDREHEVRCRGCEVCGEAEGSDEQRDMDDASPDAEEAGDKTDDGAVGDPAKQRDVVLVGGAVAVGERSVRQMSPRAPSASRLADQEPDGQDDENDRHQKIEL